MDGIAPHPDIMSKNQDMIIELKDTVSDKRLTFSDNIFRSYFRQLLYYLVMTGIEKGIISVRYNVKEIKSIKSDSQGNSYFLRPADGKDVGIESWQIFLRQVMSLEKY